MFIINVGCKEQYRKNSVHPFVGQCGFSASRARSASVCIIIRAGELHGTFSIDIFAPHTRTFGGWLVWWVWVECAESSGCGLRGHHGARTRFNVKNGLSALWRICIHTTDVYVCGFVCRVSGRIK